MSLWIWLYNSYFFVGKYLASYDATCIFCITPQHSHHFIQSNRIMVISAHSRDQSKRKVISSAKEIAYDAVCILLDLLKILKNTWNCVEKVMSKKLIFYYCINAINMNSIRVKSLFLLIASLIINYFYMRAHAIS